MRIPKREGLPHMQGREVSHATYNAGCRCDGCRAATAIRHREMRERRIVANKALWPLLNHGVYSTYVNYECRCQPCRAANAEYRRRQYRSERAS